VAEVSVAACSRILVGAAVIAVLLGTAGCRRTPSPERAQKLLIGKWRLVVKSDCNYWGVDSDILVLHSDGKMEQHLTLLNGQHYDSVHEHWEYLPDHSISLDRRLVVSDPQHAGIPRLEVLILEFSDPPVMLLNPHEDCFYERFSSE
jgi:hypothetical protein